MSTPPCAFCQAAAVRIPCESCNRSFRSQACFDRHETNKLNRKTVCEQKRNCTNCGSLLTLKKHEFFKPYCVNCLQNRDLLGFWKHSRYKILRFGNSTRSKFGLPSTILFAVWDSSWYRRRLWAFWKEKTLVLRRRSCRRSHLSLWCKRVVAIVQNARGYDAQFILQRAI